MSGHDIVVIGGSAGSLNVLRQLLARLPAGFPAAVFVVMHISRHSRGNLPSVLDRAGSLPAQDAIDGAVIKRAAVFVAPPDRHLLLRPGHMLLRRSPYENRTRPAIDPLFRSAAIAYRSRVIGVVLSGLLDDGTAGLVAVKSCGGISVVQDPQDADWPEMPSNALHHDHVDHSVTAAAMSDLLATLVRQPPGPMTMIPWHLLQENRIAMDEAVVPGEPRTLGQPSHVTCPQCGGVLNELPGQGGLRFRCQIGHALSMESLMAAQNDEIERALDTALRIHRERIGMFRRMQDRSEARGLSLAAAQWRERVEESERAAASLTKALETFGAAQSGHPE